MTRKSWVYASLGGVVLLMLILATFAGTSITARNSLRSAALTKTEEAVAEKERIRAAAQAAADAARAEARAEADKTTAAAQKDANKIRAEAEQIKSEAKAEVDKTRIAARPASEQQTVTVAKTVPASARSGGSLAAPAIVALSAALAAAALQVVKKRWQGRGTG